uniref:Uncharacterized protein n=1 Tax=Knipowitschia caucasica TaxID=637954 RepID=A0AAV2JZA4_KNICA
MKNSPSADRPPSLASRRNNLHEKHPTHLPILFKPPHPYQPPDESDHPAPPPPLFQRKTRQCAPHPAPAPHNSTGP